MDHFGHLWDIAESQEETLNSAFPVLKTSETGVNAFIKLN